MWHSWRSATCTTTSPIYKALSLRWIAVLVYVAVIYLTIPYAPSIWVASRARLGTSFGAMAFYPLMAAGAFVLIYGVCRTHGSSLTLLSLSAIGGVYYYGYHHAFQTPAEKLHLIEYGLLTWMIDWAWQPNPTQWLAGAAGTWLLNAAFGATDEVIQHYTLGRYGEFRDVVTNWVSAALALAVLLVIRKPWRGVGGLRR